jgi:hypothetical protein
MFVCLFVCLMVLDATFNNISFISWRSFYWWSKPEYPKKTTDLSQVKDKLYKMKLYQVHLTLNRGFELTAIVVTGTDCIGSCKSNYCMIMTALVIIIISSNTGFCMWMLFYFSSSFDKKISIMFIIQFFLSIICIDCTWILLCPR